MWVTSLSKGRRSYKGELRQIWGAGIHTRHKKHLVQCFVTEKNPGMRDAWVELQALPLLETASGHISNTPFLLPLVPSSVGTRGGCRCRREQSSYGASAGSFPSKGSLCLSLLGVLGTSLCRLNKHERVVWFCQDGQSCLGLC